MTESTALAIRPEQQVAIALADQSKRTLLRDTLATGLTESEFELFCEVASAKGLDPFSGQIHALKRGGKNPKMSIQTGIDGLRLIAIRTGEYGGQDGPYWCGDDGKWVDVWLSNTLPAAAKVGVLRQGFAQPLFAVATFREYAQYTSFDGKRQLNSMWQSKGALMLAKCAEAMALRKAFPAECSGLYSDDEMMQADNPPAAAPATNRAQARKDLASGAAAAESKAQAREQDAKANAEETAKHERIMAALPDWCVPIYTIVINLGHKMSELEPIVGEKPSPSRLKEFGAECEANNLDPYQVVRDWIAKEWEAPSYPSPELRERVAEEAAASEVIEAEYVDVETGEIIGSEATSVAAEELLD